MLLNRESPVDLQKNELVTKYYVKILSLYDENQIGQEAQLGWEHLLLAEKINQDVLIKVFKNKKETIKLQLKKMMNLKQFMSVV